jgi:hypothetical protein
LRLALSAGVTGSANKNKKDIEPGRGTRGGRRTGFDGGWCEAFVPVWRRVWVRSNTDGGHRLCACDFLRPTYIYASLFVLLAVALVCGFSLLLVKFSLSFHVSPFAFSLSRALHLGLFGNDLTLSPFYCTLFRVCRHFSFVVCVVCVEVVAAGGEDGLRVASALDCRFFVVSAALAFRVVLCVPVNRLDPITLALGCLSSTFL